MDVSFSSVTLAKAQSFHHQYHPSKFGPPNQTSSKNRKSSIQSFSIEASTAASATLSGIGGDIVRRPHVGMLNYLEYQISQARRAASYILQHWLYWEEKYFISPWQGVIMILFWFRSSVWIWFLFYHFLNVFVVRHKDLTSRLVSLSMFYESKTHLRDDHWPLAVGSLWLVFTLDRIKVYLLSPG